MLAGQEAERLRIAQELHDQVGQELTAVLLVLVAAARRRVPAELRADVARDPAARCAASLEDVRRIAVELRPEALDDLGLISALAVLGERFAERSALDVVERDRAGPARAQPRRRARRLPRRPGGADQRRPPLRRDRAELDARQPTDGQAGADRHATTAAGCRRAHGRAPGCAGCASARR